VTFPAIASTRLAVEKACLETVDRVVATSPQEQEHMRKLVSAQGAIEMVPCGTDIERLGSIERPAARQQLVFHKKLRWCCMLVALIGVRELRLWSGRSLHQVADDADLRLIIAGGFRPGQSDGIERDRIQGIVKELGLEAVTTFPGRLSESDLPIYYAAANVCVVPSHYEPFGLVAIEAMACRTPVVASNVGGLQFTVVPEVTGLLAPPQDEVAFAQGIDRILSNPAWGEQLGQMGRQRVEIAMSWDSVASRLGCLYNKLLSQTAPVSAKTSSASSVTRLTPDVVKVRGSVA
jgi:D-inositol-3-phosphate glycosyltransferase